MKQMLTQKLGIAPQLSWLRCPIIAAAVLAATIRLDTADVPLERPKQQ